MQRFNRILAVALGLILATSAQAFSADPFSSPPVGDPTNPGMGNGMVPAMPVSQGPQQNPGLPQYGVVPGPPTAPNESSRPASWPTNPDLPGTGGAAGPSTPVADLRLVEEAQVLGRVGTDIVTVHDVVAGISDLLSRNRDKIQPGQIEVQRTALVSEVTAGLHDLLDHINEPDAGSFVDPQRRALLAQLIHQQIETKLIYQDFHRKVPKESLPNIEEALGRQFDTELKDLYKRENAQNSPELEQKLRAKGSSIEYEKRMFFEKVIAQQWIHQEVNPESEITHDQMLEWYQAHLTEFDKPARARWEELQVAFARHGSRDETYAAMAQLGNQVLLGAPFGEVAKARSDGLSASKGGLRDWTTKGSLVCEELDRALFALPIGQLSPIIEDRNGYHIVRVVERQDASRTPFSEAQKEVHDKIKKERSAKAYKEFIERLQKQFPIWTVFDDTAKKAKTAQAEEPSRY